MNIDIDELERKASEVSGWSGCTVLELIGEVRRLRAELAAAQAHKFFCITELQRVNDLMLSEAGVGLVDQRVFELTDSCALDAAIKSATATQTSDWPTPEPIHLQAITFAYEKGFAAGLSGRNTENVFAETGGQRAAFDIGLQTGRISADRSCGACIDACAHRGSCRVKDESPRLEAS